MKEKRNQFKKYLLLIVLTSSTAIADTELPALPFQKHNLVYAASNAFASLSRRAASYSAVIVQDGRDDGVFFNGPALTSSSTQTPNARGSQYLNTVVQVQEIDTTRRSNGSIYEYAKILDNGRTFWIDLRAVFRLDTVLSTQSLNVGTVYLNQDNRNDGVYFNGPALTSANTLKPDAQGSQYNGDSLYGHSKLRRLNAILMVRFILMFKFKMARAVIGSMYELCLTRFCQQVRPHRWATSISPADPIVFMKGTLR